jgi:hypothetical protein
MRKSQLGGSVLFITENYEILGEKDDDWEHFKKDTEYEGFLVRRARQK